MSISSRIKIFSLFILGLGLIPTVQAGPISTIVGVGPSQTNYTAGAGTTTFTVLLQDAAGEGPSAGETVFLELLDGNGDSIPNAFSPSSFVTTNSPSTTTFYTSGIQLPLATFYTAASNLRVHAYTASGKTNQTFTPFIVNPGAASKFVLIGPGQTYDPGKNPSTSGYVGKTGSVSPPQADQPFDVRVILTDAQYNKVASTLNVNFTAEPTLIDLPASPSSLTNGDRVFSFTIHGPKLERNITVTDTPGATITETLQVTTEGAPAEEVFPFPSPFNPHLGQTMTLRFRLDNPASVTLKIADQFGQVLWQRDVAGAQGNNDVTWDGKNDRGETVAAGAYIVFLEAGGSLKSKKKLGVLR